MNYTYILLPENTGPENLQSYLDDLSTAENANLKNDKIQLTLQPLYEIALGKDLSNPIGPTMMSGIVWIIGGLSFVVILSACFNYTNLSIARSFRRSREVGIRKVIGALRGHVAGQFIAEAIIISLLALVLSFGMFILLRPAFLSLAPELSNIVTLDLTWQEIIYFLMLAIAVGLLAGILPAAFFSRIKAIQVLKDASSLKVFRNVAMRKILIVVQYTFSLMFIAATIIGYKQYKHFLSFDLGFNTENILNIRLRGNDPDVVMKAFGEVPEITAQSRSFMITSIGSYWGAQMKYTDPDDSAGVFYNTIDEHYIPLHGHQLIAGTNFTAKPDSAVESEVIVNEQVLKRFKIADGDPLKAIGETVELDDKPVQILGVVKDFHYGKVDSNIDLFMFRYSPRQGDFINAKVSSTDWPETLARIEALWKKIDPVHPLDATFYDDQIQNAYSEFMAMLKIIGFLAFLAISIASMGLLGMVVFTTETRTKEISIRKVLGASEGNLIYILSRGFLVLLFISAMVALPATYLFFDKFALASITYRAPISVVELLISLAVVMLIAFVMIGSQTIRVARSNPAEVLKTE
jgi:ABC-type antimicrobial peptide transport system permease subunit